MARVCLPKTESDEIKRALKDGRIKLDALFGMSSIQRRNTFSQYVGADLAPMVNARFEQALISKQKNALTNFIKSLNVKEPIRREMTRRVEKSRQVLTPENETEFLEDLARTKLGMEVTEEEAETLIRMKDEIDRTVSRVTPDMADDAIERFEAGMARDLFDTYVGNMKLQAKSLSPRERLKLENMGRNIKDLAGVSKAMVASVDNSLVGRQGIKVFFTNPRIWFDTLGKTIELFGKQLVAKSNGLFKGYDDAAESAVRAWVKGSDNALNGKYKAAKNGYGLGVGLEEAFPTSFPEKVPLLGRVFKASEAAFNTGALYMRKRLADTVIREAEEKGINMLDEANATAFGKLVSSMTGRGEIGRLSTIGEEVNVLLFSVRFLKSNLDTLTAHRFDRTMTPEAKKLALKNLMKIAAGISGIMALADMMQPGSVEWDPRKGRFGKIRIGRYDFDITGGMGGLVTFASRLLSKHNGEWGMWKYSSNTGKWTKLNDAVYGQESGLDFIERFFEGKMSPAAGAVRDLAKGTNFEGDKPTFENTLKNMFIPISAQNIMDGLAQGNDGLLMMSLGEMFGFSATSNVMVGYGKKFEELQAEVGDAKYGEIMRDITDEFNEELQDLVNSRSFNRKDVAEQNKEVDAIRKKITDRELRVYGIK